MEEDEYTYVEASCHCELNSFAVRFTTLNLPISSNFCHCSTCRHISGELAVSYVPIDGVPLPSSRPGSRRIARQHRSPSPSPTDRRNHAKSPSRRDPSPNYLKKPTAILVKGNSNTADNGLLSPPILITVEPPPPSPFDLSTLTAYKPSCDSATRYFCGTCSAQLLQVRTPTDGGGSDRWSVTVGALDETEEIVQTAAHIWVGDTLDGGFADHLTTVGGQVLPRYKEGVGSEQLPLVWNKPPVSRSHNPSPNEHLPSFCHCRAITFNISRPDEDSTTPSCYFPDLLYPYSTSRLSRIRNLSDQKWWLRNNDKRYLAGYCMCTTCRLTSGFQLQSWAFIPRSNILDPRTNEGMCLYGDSEARLPGLKQYMSSLGKYREFCGVCGATVFWWEAGAPDLIDVSVGLLDEKVCGARVESWLDWHKERISFEDMTPSPGLAKDLLEGLKASKSSKSYTAN